MTRQDRDPRPSPPEKPLPTDCCETGCEVCVFDRYADERAAYRAALKSWLRRHLEADDGANTA